MEDDSTADPRSERPEVVAAPGAGSSAGWQPTQLAPLPPLPPGEIGWMGVPGGWQQRSHTAGTFAQASGWDQQCAAAGTYAQAGGWHTSAAGPSYAPPQVEYLTQAQAQVGGVVFLCDPRTEDECLQRRLLGMPASQAQILSQLLGTQA